MSVSHRGVGATDAARDAASGWTGEGTRGIRRRRLALLARIERRYATVIEPLRVGPIELAFTRAADPDAVLDLATAEEARGGRQVLPYWAELWESSFAVGEAAAAVAASADPGGCRVLDLGCGMGLAGCCAAAAGARVVLGDVETPALLFARLNALPFGRRVRARRVDWRADDLGERFDLILGADVLYDRAEWPFLEAFWRRHLADGSGGGRVLLGEPGRPTGGEFLDWIARRGWRWAESGRAVVGRKGPAVAVRVFDLAPRSPI